MRGVGVTNTSYKKTIQFTALTGRGYRNLLNVLYRCDISNHYICTVLFLLSGTQRSWPCSSIIIIKKKKEKKYSIYSIGANVE